MSDLKMLQMDPWLEPHGEAIWQRIQYFNARKTHFMGEQSIREFAGGHHHYGLQRQGDFWVMREWAPNATGIYLVGECNQWEVDDAFRFKRVNNRGDWQLSLDAKQLSHGQLYRLLVQWDGGQGERLPAYATRVVQNEESKGFDAQVWAPAEAYAWQHESFRPSLEAPLIYEAHIGMAQEEEKVGTFIEFRDKVLPRIKAGGYNAVQLMALMEHPYYGSFGYQVSNFFAVSSRFGTPEDFKSLVDACHAQGIAVIMDLIHSHAVKNELEGLGNFDGTEHQYFHGGERGQHPAWDSRCFDYGKPEVVHFLLSNVRYWMETFKLDGFRFDGVTSMLYHHHGLGVDFDDYGKYFDDNVDKDGVVYLSLANALIHELNPSALSIAEDMSGMPGMGLSPQDGGMGFDYRLAMGIPDMWMRLLENTPDESWSVSDIFSQLRGRRDDIRTIGYVESHDQALVGDKTAIFWLMDKDMYTGMQRGQANLVVERGMALHKLLRLMTLTVAGEGYLNFMGNEFGHPEWVDFPREGNNWSYKFARRQWSLMDDEALRYLPLSNFDREILQKCGKYIGAHKADWLMEHSDHHCIAYRLGPLVLAFNFHPERSEPHLNIPIHDPMLGDQWELCLSSDEVEYDGYGRVVGPQDYIVRTGDDGQRYIEVYLPARCAIVLVENSSSSDTEIA